MVRIPFLFLFVLIVWNAAAEKTPFRIIGYLPTYRFSAFETLEVEKLTHLNIAFAQATPQGTLTLKGDFPYIIQGAKWRNPDIKVMASLAGGALTSTELAAWKKYMSPANCHQFVHEIINFVHEHGFDGIDVDLEGNHINSDYPNFTKILSDSARHYNLEISAAFPAIKRGPVLSTMEYDVFDFINIMAYDNAGPWQPTVIKQHSSYDFALKSLNFWALECKVPPEKLVLGMPCYGYDFAAKPVRGKMFSAIIKDARELAFDDNFYKTYYNSIPTIIEKTRLARERCSGVMLWELGQDALAENGDLSLLHYVHRTAISENGEPFLPIKSRFSVHYSPSDELAIYLDGAYHSDAYFVLQDIAGCTYETIPFSDYTNVINFDFSPFRRGIYTLTLIEPGIRPETKKIMKLKG